jgi:hypothetical protein
MSLVVYSVYRGCQQMHENFDGNYPNQFCILILYLSEHIQNIYHYYIWKPNVHLMSQKGNRKKIKKRRYLKKSCLWVFQIG